jgi:hypothetical protein
MPVKCPLFNNGKILCRVKADSQHRWVGTERTWYIRNYCETDYHVDCEDFEAYLEQQAILKGKILVVDDEPAMLETLSSFFTGRGYQLMTAASAEAISASARGLPTRRLPSSTSSCRALTASSCSSGSSGIIRT